MGILEVCRYCANGLFIYDVTRTNGRHVSYPEVQLPRVVQKFIHEAKNVAEQETTYCGTITIFRL